MKKHIISFSILFTLVLGLSNLAAQRVFNGETEMGLLFPETQRPNLELKLINLDENNHVLTQGESIELDLLIFNSGQYFATQCNIIIESDSESLIINNDFHNNFNLAPLDTITVSVPVTVASDAEVGISRLKFKIEEANGYDLFPARNVHVNIIERVDIDITLVDKAIRDPREMGFISQFETVDIFMRFQNCMDQALNNAVATIEMNQGTLRISGNPRIEIGRMEPNETRDVQARVSSGLGAEKVSVKLTVKSDEAELIEDVEFKFLTDYVTPDKMVDDFCDSYIPEVPFEITDSINSIRYSAKSPQNNKVAIIVANQYYYNLPTKHFAMSIGNTFITMLTQHMSYRSENIFPFTNLIMFDMENVFRISGADQALFNLRRLLRRASEPIDLTIYYAGYAAADLFHGEIYLLPINFSETEIRNRYPLSEMYKSLNEVKNDYNINSVTVFLDLEYIMVSETGNKNEKEFSIAEFHENNSGFTSFIGTNAYNNQRVITQMMEFSELYPFSNLVISGLSGRADYNKDQTITSFELYRFLNDEIFGIPGISWNKYNMLQLPIFFGDDIVLY